MSYTFVCQLFFKSSFNLSNLVYYSLQKWFLKFFSSCSKPFHQHSATDIEKVFRVNTFSHFWTVDEFLPDFIRQKRGHIVCLSSIAGIVGTSNLTAYW